MKVSLSTGGVQDFVQFTPETAEEASALSQVATSEFLTRPKMFFIDYTQAVMRLRIYVSETRPETKELSAEEREELDQQA